MFKIRKNDRGFSYKVDGFWANSYISVLLINDIYEVSWSCGGQATDYVGDSTANFVAALQHANELCKGLNHE